LSMTLATKPTIAIDDQSGALNIAIILGQVAKNMLLTQAPMPVSFRRSSIIVRLPEDTLNNGRLSMIFEQPRITHYTTYN
ncbi:hypothetical protein IAF53_21075, partial [Acinetobacter baumannii]|nr:hypothetical protein [Acinetobacter baumannii]